MLVAGVQSLWLILRNIAEPAQVDGIWLTGHCPSLLFPNSDATTLPYLTLLGVGDVGHRFTGFWGLLLSPD